MELMFKGYFPVYSSKMLKYLLLSLLLTLSTQAENKIYDPNRDGLWFPVTYAVNGTFDVIQNPYWFSQKNYTEKMSEVWRRVKEPDRNIKRDGGYKKFIQDEFFSSRVLPNIGLHFLGGAYDTLWLTEYFKAYGYPAPRAFAFFFTYLAHFGNEALETSSNEITSHDHIADIYLFDAAAFLFASYPKGMNFLLDDMGMKAWHFNPMYDVDGENFFNAGLNYVFRPKMAYLMEGKLRPLYFLGMQTLAGASYKYQNDRDISVAMGISLTNPLKQKGRFVTGIFHESNGELDASLFLNGSEDFRWRVNLYDNLWKRVPFLPQSWRLGIMAGQAKGPNYAFGVNINLPIGIGGIKNQDLHYGRF